VTFVTSIAVTSLIVSLAVLLLAVCRLRKLVEECMLLQDRLEARNQDLSILLRNAERKLQEAVHEIHILKKSGQASTPPVHEDEEI